MRVSGRLGRTDLSLDAGVVGPVQLRVVLHVRLVGAEAELHLLVGAVLELELLVELILRATRTALAWIQKAEPHAGNAGLDEPKGRYLKNFGNLNYVTFPSHFPFRDHDFLVLLPSQELIPFSMLRTKLTCPVNLNRLVTRGRRTHIDAAVRPAKLAPAIGLLVLTRTGSAGVGLEIFAQQVRDLEWKTLVFLWGTTRILQL